METQVAGSPGLPAVWCVVSQNFSSSTYSLAAGSSVPSRARAGCKRQPQKEESALVAVLVSK